MKRFEHNVLSHRGAMNDDILAMLANLGSDGWQIVSAYAIETGVTQVHHFVLTREIDPQGSEASQALKKGKGR
jgi:hypothetical protein